MLLIDDISVIELYIVFISDTTFYEKLFMGYLDLQGPGLDRQCGT
jgi:hypothetical protein